MRDLCAALLASALVAFAGPAPAYAAALRPPDVSDALTGEPFAGRRLPTGRDFTVDCRQPNPEVEGVRLTLRPWHRSVVMPACHPPGKRPGPLVALLCGRQGGYPRLVRDPERPWLATVRCNGTSGGRR
jgi:hypothetical protein